MGQVSIQKKSAPVEFVIGMKMCFNCGSIDIEETELYIKCRTCGMGKNKSGRR